MLLLLQTRMMNLLQLRTARVLILNGFKDAITAEALGIFMALEFALSLNTRKSIVEYNSQSNDFCNDSLKRGYRSIWQTFLPWIWACFNRFGFLSKEESNIIIFIICICGAFCFFYINGQSQSWIIKKYLSSIIFTLKIIQIVNSDWLSM